MCFTLFIQSSPNLTNPHLPMKNVEVDVDPVRGLLHRRDKNIRGWSMTVSETIIYNNTWPRQRFAREGCMLRRQWGRALIIVLVLLIIGC